MANINFRFWQDITKALIDHGDGSWKERVEAYPPTKLMTDGDGDYSRVRVDVGQTGFFAGREAYTWTDFTIPTGENLVIKVVSPINSIVQIFGADLKLASIRLSLIVGGTEGGTFSTALPILKTNNMSTASSYTPQVTMHSGGTLTGGMIVNAFDLISGSNENKASETTASNELPFGFPAGTYYVKIENTDGNDAIGIFRARWEERL